MTSAEACRRLGVERRTLIRWANEGHIRVLRLGTGNRKFDVASVLPENANLAPETEDTVLVQGRVWAEPKTTGATQCSPRVLPPCEYLSISVARVRRKCLYVLVQCAPSMKLRGKATTVDCLRNTMSNTRNARLVTAPLWTGRRRACGYATIPRVKLGAGRHVTSGACSKGSETNTTVAP